MLRSPSAAPDHLRLLFEYQLSTLDRLRESDAAIEDSKGMNITHVTEIIRSCDDVSQPSLIAAHIGPKYDLPRHLQNVPTPSNSNKSKPKTKRIYAERNTSANTAGTTSNSTAREIVTPSSECTSPHFTHALFMIHTTDITVGGLYDPRLLPDYGGSMFHHVHAKLVQKDITDIDGELIPMWETYDKLRTGTLVLMKGQFTMYQMEDKQRDGYKKVSFARETCSNAHCDQFYQFNVHRTYVLARSEEPFEVPEKPSLPAFMKELETTNKRDAADDILDSVFSLKRAKTSSDDSGRTVIPEETPGSSSTQAMPPKVRSHICAKKRNDSDVAHLKIIDSRKTRTSTRGKKTDPKEKGKAADDMDNVEDKIEDAMPVDNED